MKPMTEEQRALAEANHHLVYSFLKEHQLPESEYYDVVVFGLLRAAQDYCEKRRLKRYRFSTVAWKKMACELKDHQRYLASQKADLTAVSIHDPISEDNAQRWEDVLHDESVPLNAMLAELALHDLAVTPMEQRILQMKRSGERMHDIAKTEGLTFRQINAVLSRLKKLLKDSIYLFLWRMP